MTEITTTQVSQIEEIQFQQSSRDQLKTAQADTTLLELNALLNQQETHSDKKNSATDEASDNSNLPNVNSSLSFGQLIFVVLVECAQVQVGTAIVKAEALSVNAADLEALNNQEKSLQLFTVPKEIITYKTVDGQRVTDIVNDGVIAYYQGKNNVIMGERQVLTQRSMEIQQDEKVKIAQVNTIANATSATESEASTIQTMIRSLTFLALLRQPPQGA